MVGSNDARSLIPHFIHVILLFLSRVPAKLGTYTVYPVLAAAAVRLDAGEWEATGTYGHVVAWEELDTRTPIEAGPAVIARIVRYTDTQHDGVGENDGTEG